MALTGPEGLIQELPPAWRRVAYAALLAISVTVAYFTFIAGPIASAKDATVTNGKRIDKVEADINTIKNDVSDIKANAGARDQKVDDIRDRLGDLNQKVDRMLMLMGRSRGVVPDP